MKNQGSINIAIIGLMISLITGCADVTPTIYMVVYEANGATSGTAPTDAAAYKTGQTVTVLGNTGSLARTSCVYAGWNLSTVETGTHYTAGSGTFTMGSSDVILYAEWHPKLLASDLGSEDNFGGSVAISGGYAIVGVYAESSFGTNSGAAYIYHRTAANAWDGGTKIVAADAQAADRFGSSASISGEHAIFGAYGDDDGANAAGATYIRLVY